MHDYIDFFGMLIVNFDLHTGQCQELSIMRRFVLCGVMAAALFAGSRHSAHADVAYTSYGVLNNQNATITFLTGSKAGTSETGGSGQVTLNGITNNDVSGDPLNTWCVDVYDDLAGSGSFSTVTSYASANPLFAEIDALISHATTQLLSQDYDASAAIQVAIWKVEYGNTVSITSAQSVNDLAMTYVDNVTNGTWQADPNTAVSVLHGVGNQDQAYLANVPEPASMAMLVMGLIGTGVIGRRRASARME